MMKMAQKAKLAFKKYSESINANDIPKDRKNIRIKQNYK